MEDIKLSSLPRVAELIRRLTTVECKMLLMILYYLGRNNKKLIIHNVEFREYLASMNFLKPLLESVLYYLH